MEVIWDTNIIYKYPKLFKSYFNNYLPSYYNFEDLLASKDNITKIDARLRKTIQHRLRNINQHEVLIFEPHYYILREIFPNSKPNKILYDRANEHDRYSFINILSAIIRDGENVSDELKNAVIEYAKKHQIRKQTYPTETVNHAKYIYQDIGYNNNSLVNYIDFIPYVKSLLVNNLNSYGNKFMLHCGSVTENDLDFVKYELFIKCMARYLAGLVSKNKEDPGKNDNIDTQILLYVTKGRKFMTCEKKWLKIIKDVRLHKKYLRMCSSNPFKHFWYNYICLNLFGFVNQNDC